ncbi:hypothetical protein [Corynebacterium sp.]|uniref:hypothetical protein n=1 Tax=Corynebacterium sp. TaxID=1720 RepID=UPI0025BD74FD|nr:hypothetical protein [Corynebacterium sp.]
MSGTSKTAPSPLDDRAREVVERLHAQNRHQFVRSFFPLVREMAKAKSGTGNRDHTRTDSGKEMLADKMVALDPEKAALCHLLCRSLRARTVVDIRTPFGVATAGFPRCSWCSRYLSLTSGEWPRDRVGRAAPVGESYSREVIDIHCPGS